MKAFSGMFKKKDEKSQWKSAQSTPSSTAASSTSSGSNFSSGSGGSSGVGGGVGAGGASSLGGGTGNSGTIAANALKKNKMPSEEIVNLKFERLLVSCCCFYIGRLIV